MYAFYKYIIVFYFTHQVTLWLENTSLQFSAIHLMKTSSDVISKSKNQHHICVLCIKYLIKTTFFFFELSIEMSHGDRIFNTLF